MQRTVGILSWDSWQVFLLAKLTLLLLSWCRDSSIVAGTTVATGQSRKLEINNFGLNSVGQ